MRFSELSCLVKLLFTLNKIFLKKLLDLQNPSFMKSRQTEKQIDLYMSYVSLIFLVIYVLIHQYIYSTVTHLYL